MNVNLPVLNNKSALVTGSTSGIGWAIAHTLAEAGCHVLLHGLGNKNHIKRLLSELAAVSNSEVGHNSTDLTQKEMIPAMIDDAEARFGGLDLLINNAGVQHVSPVETFSTERWDSVIAINLSAAFHTIRSALPGMKRRNWGRIVNISSAHGLVGSPNKAAYVASKHGLIGLTKVVALETAKIEITCNAICPGWVRTPLIQDQLYACAQQEDISMDGAARKLLRDKQPSMKFVEANDIGAWVAYLCGDSASAITGAVLSIDGGWTCV